VPANLKDGQPHLIRARILGTTNELRNSPKPFQAVTCDGFLENVSASEIVGWAVDRARLDASVDVEILDGTNLLATVKADLYREDLKKSGLGNGQHKFRLIVPASLKDGQPHAIHARLADTKIELRNSPKTLVAPPPRKP